MAVVNKASSNKSKIDNNGIKLKDLIQGRIISNEFFLKNWKLIILVTVLLFFYISNRYICLMQISKIVELQGKLRDIKYEALTLSSDLIGIGRQSEVKKLITEKNLLLEESNKPPFEISK